MNIADRSLALLDLHYGAALRLLILSPNLTTRGKSGLTNGLT
ncbi:hypothetical protein ACVXG7_03405 [Enterobacter hormaechei]